MPFFFITNSADIKGSAPYTAPCWPGAVSTANHPLFAFKYNLKLCSCNKGLLKKKILFSFLNSHRRKSKGGWMSTRTVFNHKMCTNRRPCLSCSFPGFSVQTREIRNGHISLLTSAPARPNNHFYSPCSELISIFYSQTILCIVCIIC